MNALSTILTSGEALFFAHADPTRLAGPRSWSELARAWEWDPLPVFALLVSAWVYRRGVRRLWAEAGRGRGLRRWEVAAFWAGWWTLAIALVSPLHPWGQVLFAAHMTQHELLMVAAAPLLVLGRPMVAVLFALPREDARELSQVARVGWARGTWRVLTNPLVAWALHAAALWVWHVPRFFQATLTSTFVHDLQHVSFFGSALLFWWALIHGRAGLRGFGVALLYLFTTMMHSGLLGALITFSDSLIYPAYAATAADWSLTGLEDQQLGGLIMWVPAGLVYVVAALALVAGWMRASERSLSDWAPGAAAGRMTLLLVLLVLVSGCNDRGEQAAAAKTGGDPRIGREIITRTGCAGCHTIPGIRGADARVGPSLAGIATQSYLGGVMPNTPENMMKWVRDPRAHSPKTVMPNVGLSETDARHVAAYLSTLTD